MTLALHSALNGALQSLKSVDMEPSDELILPEYVFPSGWNLDNGT